MNFALIPETYEQWRRHLTPIRKQPPSPHSTSTRIQALSSGDYMARNFVEMYDDQRYAQTLQWFEQAEGRFSVEGN